MIPNEIMEDDTIPVRSEERFNEKKLANYLKENLKGTEGILNVRQFGGGAANLTYLLDFGNNQFVLRRPPLGLVAKSAHDMSREFKALSVLYKDFHFAPRAFHFCDELDIIGAPFFIMERKKGLIIRNSFPKHYQHTPNLAYRISKSVVDCLVKLHKVDYKSLGLEKLGHNPEKFISRQIEGWYKRWQEAKIKTLNEMKNVYLWLLDNNPTTSVVSLIHNDFKLDNIMLDINDPEKIVAVFDWDMCTLGDPLSDLGALLAYWSEPKDPDYRKEISTMPTENIGFMTRKDLVKRYTQQVGQSIANINYYHALGLFRLTVIIAQIFIRYHRGQTQDQRFSGLGKIIPLVARAAEDVTLE